MNEAKKISFLIITHNRAETLRYTLQRLIKIYKPGYEIIVVDNNSSDSTESIIAHFPEVIYKKLKRNIGIQAWNVAAKVSSGELLFFLDDDSYPEIGVAEKSVDIMNSNKRLGILACKIINKSFHFVETDEYSTEPKMFIGCGAIIRRNVFFETGGFNKFQFVYYHELDFTARCRDLGYKILYDEDLVVFHDQVLIRNGSENPYISGFRYYHHYLSYMVFLLQRFSAKYTIKYVTKYFLNRLILAFRYRFFKEFLRASWKLMVDFRKILKGRKVLSEEVQMKMDYGNISLIDKI